MKKRLVVVLTLLLSLSLAGTTVSAQPAECHGSCYGGTDSECHRDTIATNVNCSDCVYDLVGYWKPDNGSSDCFNRTPHDLCINYCVECCNGTDDDVDGQIDFPNDTDCTCGLDPSESEKLPPIPELSTFLLMGIGLLALAGYFVQKKRRG